MKTIVRFHDYYLKWSSITDSPVTFGMLLDDFKEYFKEEYGNKGMRELDRRLERVEFKGTSAQFSQKAQIISGNRAGPDETELTEGEIYKAYCKQEPIRDGWVVLEYEED